MAVNLSESHTFHKKDDTSETTVAEMRAKGELTPKDIADTPRRSNSLDIETVTPATSSAKAATLAPQDVGANLEPQRSASALSISIDEKEAEKEIARTEEPKMKKVLTPEHPSGTAVPAQVAAGSTLDNEDSMEDGGSLGYCTSSRLSDGA